MDANSIIQNKSLKLLDERLFIVYFLNSIGKAGREHPLFTPPQRLSLRGINGAGVRLSAAAKIPSGQDGFRLHLRQPSRRSRARRGGCSCGNGTAPPNGVGRGSSRAARMHPSGAGRTPANRGCLSVCRRRPSDTGGCGWWCGGRNRVRRSGFAYGRLLHPKARWSAWICPCRSAQAGCWFRRASCLSGCLKRLPARTG